MNHLKRPHYGDRPFWSADLTPPLTKPPPSLHNSLPETYLHEELFSSSLFKDYLILQPSQQLLTFLSVRITRIHGSSPACQKALIFPLSVLSAFGQPTHKEKLRMGPYVEANSLSDITQIASNPPKYPRNPTEKQRPPLTLYIARVPGSQGQSRGVPF